MINAIALPNYDLLIVFYDGKYFEIKKINLKGKIEYFSKYIKSVNNILDKNKFQNISFGSWGVEWLDTEGFSLGEDTLYKESETVLVVD